MTHTPLPWGYREHEEPANNGHDDDYIYTYWIVDKKGNHVISNISDFQIMNEEDLKFIVTACNAHDDLVAALEATRPTLVRASSIYEEEYATSTLSMDSDFINPYEEKLQIIDAALAKAKGTQS